MYYIKSGDISPTSRCASLPGRLLFTRRARACKPPRTVLKPNDKAHYALDAASKEGDVVKVRLKYLKGTQAEKQKDEIVAAVQKAGAGGTAESGADIRRWLNRFMARNQSDFFIHKRLKEALAEDLDIYIKIEVLDADQLLAGGDLPKRTMKVARIVREVGIQIIDFLAALEDFQKALWEKKKLVFETRYVITLDRLERYCPAWLTKNIGAIVAAASSGRTSPGRHANAAPYPQTKAIGRRRAVSAVCRGPRTRRRAQVGDAEAVTAARR